jgi:hypothetical protein
MSRRMETVIAGFNGDEKPNTTIVNQGSSDVTLACTPYRNDTMFHIPETGTTITGSIVYSDQFYNVHTTLDDIELKDGLIYVHLNETNTGGGASSVYGDAFITIEVEMEEPDGSKYTSISSNLRLNIIPNKGIHVKSTSSTSLQLSDGDKICDNVYRYANVGVIQYIGKFTEQIFTIPDKYKSVLFVNTSDNSGFTITGIANDKIMFDDAKERYIDIKILPR